MYCDAKGIKYIHGVECYLTEQLEPKVRDNYHTILLAKNYEGVKEINRLCYIASQPDHFYYRPRLSFDEFLAVHNVYSGSGYFLHLSAGKVVNDCTVCAVFDIFNI